MENKKFAGYKAALGAFLVIFVNIGVCTTLGVFIAQLASYPWIRTCYYILMLLAIVSSTIPATYMISSRYQSALKFIPALKTDNSRNIVAAILFMVICTLIGALGLTNLANTGLTIVSYIGMPLVVIPLFFIWPQRTRKFRQAEREQAAAEQKS